MDLSSVLTSIQGQAMLYPSMLTFRISVTLRINIKVTGKLSFLSEESFSKNCLTLLDQLKLLKCKD